MQSVRLLLTARIFQLRKFGLTYISVKARSLGVKTNAKSKFLFHFTRSWPVQFWTTHLICGLVPPSLIILRDPIQTLLHGRELNNIIPSVHDIINKWSVLSALEEWGTKPSWRDTIEDHLHIILLVNSDPFLSTLRKTSSKPKKNDIQWCG